MVGHIGFHWPVRLASYILRYLQERGIVLFNHTLIMDVDSLVGAPWFVMPTEDPCLIIIMYSNKYMLVVS